MLARIYKPAKSAMQQGKANTVKWLLEFEPAAAKRIDPLMGWAGSTDTSGQVKLRFETLDEATEFATRHHIPYTVLPDHEHKPQPRAYAENFK